MELMMEWFQHLSNPDWIMANGGLYLVLAIIFIETGAFFGFFLPGDPLLFVSGMVLAAADNAVYPFTHEIFNLVFWQALFFIGAVAGNFVGYGFGKKFGPLILNQDKDYWLLKRKHMEAAQDFYHKKGGFAITIARFIPIARTFVPIIAGLVKMDFKKFAFYNVLGALIWVLTLTSLGYALGENPWVNRNLEWTLLGIVVLATLPVIIKAIIPKKQKFEQTKSSRLKSINS